MDTENEQLVEKTQTDEETTQVEDTTSEETQDEESTLAKDALDETSKEPDEESKVDPKDAVIGDFRRKVRESDLQIAELKGKIEALKPPEVKAEPEVVKSPYDLAVEEAAKEQGVGIDEAEIVFTGKLLKEQQAFDRKNHEQQTEALTKEQSDALSSQAFVVAGEKMNVTAMGEGLDFDTIMKAADGEVTKADMQWLASKSKDYPDFYKRLYDFCITAIEESGGDSAKVLQAKIATHSQAKKETKKEPEVKVPTKEEVIAKASSVQEAQINALM